MCIPVAKCIAAYYCTCRNVAILSCLTWLHDKYSPCNDNFLCIYFFDDNIYYKSFHSMRWRLWLICFALFIICLRLCSECWVALFEMVPLFCILPNYCYVALSLETTCEICFYCSYFCNDMPIKGSDTVEYARAALTIRWLYN